MRWFQYWVRGRATFWHITSHVNASGYAHAYCGINGPRATVTSMVPPGVACSKCVKYHSKWERINENQCAK